MNLAGDVPLVALLEDRGEADDPLRGIVLGGSDLGHDLARGPVGPLVLEDQPSVEPGEVVGVGQPDVGDREAARGEMAGHRRERLPLGRPRGEEEERVQGDDRQPEGARRRQRQPEEVGLDELESIALPGRAARVARPGHVRASPGRCRPPSPDGRPRPAERRAGPVPQPARGSVPPVRAASARYRSRSPGSSSRSRS